MALQKPPGSPTPHKGPPPAPPRGPVVRSPSSSSSGSSAAPASPAKAPIARAATTAKPEPAKAAPVDEPAPLGFAAGMDLDDLEPPPEDLTTSPSLQRVTKAHPAVGKDGKLDKKALIEQYTPFVRGIAAKIKKSLAKTIEFDDLLAYGMTGLLEAAERYDPKVGANFMTFSYYRIRGAIYDGLRGMGWVSRTEYQKIRFEERATQYLENVSAREVVGGEAGKSAEANLDELAQQVSQLVTIFVTSLEAMEDLQVEDKERQPIDERYADVQLKGHVREAMQRLPEADREIIQMYYFKELSLQEVGNKLGLSKSWTSRRHAQAIEKLTRILQEIMKEAPPSSTPKRR